MATGKMKVSAMGGWTFVVGSEFEVLDNGDSVQAVDGKRIVYVSSLRVGKPEAPVRAARLRATAAGQFGTGERFSHVGESVQGDAEASFEGATWHLSGTMCADGTVATCLIDFPTSEGLAWAIAVWKSLLCE
jgi:hypothetical protein